MHMKCKIGFCPSKNEAIKVHASFAFTYLKKELKKAVA